MRKNGTLCQETLGLLVLMGPLLMGVVRGQGTVPPPVAPVQQPLVVTQPGSSFESVELRRTQIAEETRKVAEEEGAAKARVGVLHAKLMRTSVGAYPVDKLPIGFLGDFRSFLSANAADIQRGEEYYRLLKATLNDLIPSNPYKNEAPDGPGNTALAEEKLQRLFEFEEDEGVSRNIMAQVAAIRGGEFEADKRRTAIVKQLKDIADMKTSALRNIQVLSQPLRATGELTVGALPRIAVEQEKIRQLEEKEVALKAEGGGLMPSFYKATRELQFQQFIVELAFQQRYIHALIASGFYRMYSRNNQVDPRAYPQQPGNGGQSSGNEPAAVDGGNSTPNAPGSGAVPAGSPVNTPGGADATVPAMPVPPTMPYLSSVPAMETFLMNRIQDSRKDREAVDNMLASDQLSAAENVVREMVLMAKYQPELHTIPYPERQRLRMFGDEIRGLADALYTSDYDAMAELSKSIEELSKDARMADVRSFSEEQRKKALRCVQQARVAYKLGQMEDASFLMDAAGRRAPLDEEVERGLRELERDIENGGAWIDDVEELVEEKKYRELLERVERPDSTQSAPADWALKPEFDRLVELEKSVREAIGKCEEFAARSSYSDVWIVVSEVDKEVAQDDRLREWREKAERQCSSFAEAFDAGRDHEEAGNAALALAWYLTAVAESPSATSKLKSRIDRLGKELAETK